jgi:hypothetical protein
MDMSGDPGFTSSRHNNYCKTKERWYSLRDLTLQVEMVNETVCRRFPWAAGQSGRRMIFHLYWCLGCIGEPHLYEATASVALIWAHAVPTTYLDVPCLFHNHDMVDQRQQSLLHAVVFRMIGMTRKEWSFMRKSSSFVRDFIGLKGGHIRLFVSSKSLFSNFNTFASWEK